ncbi:hypothetical protein DYB34_000010 [Aphanomyces astaci]|uniref:RING-type domain-containing protein n=3 Tax=Aphanomyces astaci TaxID=112090 RepID=A0A418BYS0_APHAT|nr:hypothetical protein DYB34_000010 [Aphanomyces astaci]
MSKRCKVDDFPVNLLALLPPDAWDRLSFEEQQALLPDLPPLDGWWDLSGDDATTENLRQLFRGGNFNFGNPLMSFYFPSESRTRARAAARAAFDARKRVFTKQLLQSIIQNRSQCLKQVLPADELALNPELDISVIPPCKAAVDDVDHSLFLAIRLALTASGHGVAVDAVAAYVETHAPRTIPPISERPQHMQVIHYVHSALLFLSRPATTTSPYQDDLSWSFPFVNHDVTTNTFTWQLEVTVLNVVRDAVARLPCQCGTRADVLALLRMFVNPATPAVAKGLDTLASTVPPCAYFRFHNEHQAASIVSAATSAATAPDNVNRTHNTPKKAQPRKKKQQPSQQLVPSAAVVQASVLRPNATAFTPPTGAAPDNTRHGKKQQPRQPRGGRGATERPVGPVAHRSTSDTTAEATPAPGTTTIPLSKPSNTRRSRGGRHGRTPKDVSESHDIDVDTESTTTGAATSLELCLVCAERFRYHAIGECNHYGICSTCSMRMRLLMKDFNCPICKQANPRVIVTDTVAPYASFGIWGDTGGPGVLLDDRADMFFSHCEAHYEALVRRRDLYCRRCPKSHRPKFRVLEELQLHMENDHATYFCDLCVQHQHFYVGEYPMFTMKELMLHQTAAVSATARARHPLCDIAKGFVVFQHDIDFQAHMVSVHGNHDNRLRIAFTVRRGMEEDVSSTTGGRFNDTWEFGAPPPSASSRQREEFPALPAAAPSAAPAPATRPPPPPTIRPSAVPAPSALVPRAMLTRNAQLATAFGRGSKTDDALEKELQPQYSQELKEWGRVKFRTLVAVEKKIQDMMADRACFSTHLKSMPREMVFRRMIHELAVFYGLKSESRDAEPNRFISLYKLQTSALPPTSLSKCLLDEAQGPKRQTRRARVYVDRNVKLPEGRGWEKVSDVPVAAAPQEPKDAWSDEDDAIEDVSAFVRPEGSSTRLEFLRRTDGHVSE